MQNFFLIKSQLVFTNTKVAVLINFKVRLKATPGWVWLDCLSLRTTFQHRDGSQAIRLLH